MRAKRHERLIRGLSQDKIRKDLLKTGTALASLTAAHTGAMMAFEGLNFQDALWLTLTTATTVGYGDMSAETIAGRTATTVLMYGGGIAALAQLASLYFDLRQNKSDALLNGKWRWNMDDHIVFLNAPKDNPVRYFSRLVSEFRKSALPDAQKPALIVSPNIQGALSDSLRKQGVAHVNYDVTSSEATENSNLKSASHIIVMSDDETNPISDSVTFDLVSRAREQNPNAVIIAESVLDENKPRLKAAGADHVIRPIRSYPELLVNTILAPGSEEIMADLFDNEGEELVRYDVPLQGKWGDIQCGLIQNDIGTPLGFINQDGQIVMAATIKPSDVIQGMGLFVMAREGNVHKPAVVQSAAEPKMLIAAVTHPIVPNGMR